VQGVGVQVAVEGEEVVGVGGEGVADVVGSVVVLAWDEVAG
jgi:hypothetical protein